MTCEQGESGRSACSARPARSASLRPGFDGYPRNALELADVGCDHSQSVSHAGGGEPKVVRADDRAGLAKLRPDLRVSPRAGEIHGEQREALKDALNEGGASRTHVWPRCPMHAVKEFAGSDDRQE